MNIRKYFQEGFKAYNLVIQFEKSTAYPSIIAFDIYGFLSTMNQNFDKDFKVILSKPDLFDDKIDLDKFHYYEFYIASKKSPQIIKEHVSKKISEYEEIAKYEIVDYFEEIIEQRTVVKREDKTDLKAFDIKNKKIDTIKIDVEKIEELGNLINELLSNNARINKYASHLSKNKNKQKVAVEFNIEEIAQNLDHLTNKLQLKSLEMRMVPVSTITRKFPRMVRDLSKQKNKKVELLISGEETTMDKTTLEEINGPLIHLIRNSIDHGIECEDERLENEKNPIGKIFLKIYNEGNAIVVELEDDGKGLNIEAIKEKAIQKNLITKEISDKMKYEDILNLIFSSGFTTTQEVSDISGRGVGLDVVKDSIGKLNGNVDVDSKENRGTKFTLKIPLNFVQALLVKDDGETFAIPFASVVDISSLESCKKIEYEKYMLVQDDEEFFPVFKLGKLLQYQCLGDKRKDIYLIKLVDSSTQEHYGIIVDNIIGKQEIIVRALGDYIGNVFGISGVTIGGDGKIVLIVNIKSIYKKAKIDLDINYDKIKNL